MAKFLLTDVGKGDFYETFEPCVVQETLPRFIAAFEELVDTYFLLLDMFLYAQKDIALRKALRSLRLLRLLSPQQLLSCTVLSLCNLLFLLSCKLLPSQSLCSLRLGLLRLIRQSRSLGFIERQASPRFLFACSRLLCLSSGFRVASFFRSPRGVRPLAFILEFPPHPLLFVIALVCTRRNHRRRRRRNDWRGRFRRIGGALDMVRASAYEPQRRHLRSVLEPVIKFSRHECTTLELPVQRHTETSAAARASTPPNRDTVGVREPLQILHHRRGEILHRL
mmetsp:Transcript_7849/g.26072  ORF Transcript_7849/g.26072 Transcript_7849/m.26072 type:complete len:280 (+) Transcript_7849:492-1331(+)